MWSMLQAAQAVLVPLLVDKDNVGPTGMKAIQSMMVMEPTPDFQVVCLLHLDHVMPPCMCIGLSGVWRIALCVYSADVKQDVWGFQPESGFVNVEDQRTQQRRPASSGPQLYEPAVTASWRMRMLRKGNVSDADLQRVRHAPRLTCTSMAPCACTQCPAFNHITRRKLQFGLHHFWSASLSLL